MSDKTPKWRAEYIDGSRWRKFGRFWTRAEARAFVRRMNAQGGERYRVVRVSR